jgi:diaminopimelate decarboxylase
LPGNDREVDIMQAFTYKSGKLCAEGVAIDELAKRHGTPLYIYSRGHIRERYRAIAAAMAEVKPLICYSIKANSNAAVIGTLAAEGAGFDIVSGGELFRALRAGADASKIVFAGVGKTREEIEYALKQSIRFFTCESEPEARRISECAQRLGTTGRIAFRVNPDVDPKTHKYISTGKKENKFGLDLERTLSAYAMAAALPNIEIAGLHMHIGSQILAADPFGTALTKVKDLCVALKAKYPTFRTLDIGGGLGIDYKPDQQALDPKVFAATVLPFLKELGLQVAMEPGRSIVGNAGILVCRVQYVKESYFKKFIVADAAMNDLIRPALYQAHHEILPVTACDRKVTGDLVGPICESGDFLAADRELPDAKEGDLLAVMSAGAYGYAMSSTYNSRPRAAEVMVEGDKAVLVHQRDTLEDLVKGELAFA